MTRELHLPPPTHTRPRGVGDIIADVARRWPQRRAIEVLGGPAVTYRTFDDRTTRLANALLSVASPGERIAAWLPTGIEYLEVYGAAANAAGGAFEPAWRTVASDGHRCGPDATTAAAKSASPGVGT